MGSSLTAATGSAATGSVCRCASTSCSASHAPQGGGHWILAVGHQPGRGVFNDPYGELNNPDGGYVRVGRGGHAVGYSWRHWLPRWEVEAPGTGWFMSYRLA
jgi:hypothetical protein